MKVNIQMKIMMGFSVVLVLLIAIGGIGYVTAKKVNNGYASMIEDPVKKVNLLDKMMLTHAQIVGDVRGYFLYQEERFIDTVSVKAVELEALTNELEGLISLPEHIALMGNIQAAREEYVDLTERALIIHKAGDMETFKGLAAEAAVANASFLENTDELKTMQGAELQLTKNGMGKMVTSSSLLNLILIVASVVVGIVVTFLVDRGISGPITRTTKALESVASGDLRTAPLVVKSKDEIAQMANALNTMLVTWNGVVKRINDSSIELAARSEELSASSEESLASSQMVAHSAETHLHNSETQFSHVSQSVQSLKELDTGIDKIAESNEEMLHSAKEMASLIDTGIHMVHDVSTSMSDIHVTIQESTSIMEVMAKRSIEIQEVTALITEISEQTNLLALNAAIEAARAGENGKGFAVVADEVRRLAEESKGSATKIEEMINDIRSAAEQAVQSIQMGNTKVTEGLRKSEQSLSVFSGIESSVDGVEEKIETVSAAIVEIQALSDEVSGSSEKLKHLAQDSASGARDTSAATEEQLAANEEIASSTEALASLAESLKTEIQQFQV